MRFATRILIGVAAATSVAIAGYGGGATASTVTGVNCAGLNSFALDLSTGRSCIAGL